MARLLRSAPSRTQYERHFGSGQQAVLDQIDAATDRSPALDPRLLAEAMARSDPGLPVLDLGAGTRGSIPPGPGQDRCTVLDWSVAALRAHGGRRVAGDMAALPIGTASIGLAVSNGALHLVGEPGPVFEEIARVLVGRAALLVGGLWPIAAVDAVVQEWSVLAGRGALDLVEVLDATTPWRARATAIHLARLAARDLLVQELGVSTAAAVCDVSAAMLRPSSGAIATHARRELLFARG